MIKATRTLWVTESQLTAIAELFISHNCQTRNPGKWSVRTMLKDFQRSNTIEKIICDILGQNDHEAQAVGKINKSYDIEIGTKRCELKCDYEFSSTGNIAIERLDPKGDKPGLMKPGTFDHLFYLVLEDDEFKLLVFKDWFNSKLFKVLNGDLIDKSVGFTATHTTKNGAVVSLINRAYFTEEKFAQFRPTSVFTFRF